jgi:thiamine-monophosphate kinase
MNTRTEVSSLGEFGLIDHLTKNIEIHNSSTLLGVGDDAAVIDHFGKQTLVSTDLLIEGIHFDLAYTPLKHLGYKSVMVNLSDIYAMYGTPTQITVSIAASNRFSVEALSELYDGIYLACNKMQVDVVGGDTSSSGKGLIISITAIGEVVPDQYVKRSTARKGDLICVSGDCGGAFLGLTLMEREKKIFLENSNIQPDLENEKYIVGRLLKPEARKDIIDFLQGAGIMPTSMMDVSDGISSEVLHLCKQSSTGCRIFEDKLPIAEDSRKAAFKFGLDPTICALNGGEDYELIFTIRQEDHEKILLNEDISVIGYMTVPEENCLFMSRGGNSFPLTAQGWNAF